MVASAARHAPRAVRARRREHLDAERLDHQLGDLGPRVPLLAGDEVLIADGERLEEPRLHSVGAALAQLVPSTRTGGCPSRPTRLKRYFVHPPERSWTHRAGDPWPKRDHRRAEQRKPAGSATAASSSRRSGWPAGMTEASSEGSATGASRLPTPLRSGFRRGRATAVFREAPAGAPRGEAPETAPFVGRSSLDLRSCSSSGGGVSRARPARSLVAEGESAECRSRLTPSARAMTGRVYAAAAPEPSHQGQRSWAPVASGPGSRPLPRQSGQRPARTARRRPWRSCDGVEATRVVDRAPMMAAVARAARSGVMLMLCPSGDHCRQIHRQQTRRRQPAAVSGWPWPSGSAPRWGRWARATGADSRDPGGGGRDAGARDRGSHLE